MKTTLVTLASGALAVVFALVVVPGAWADPPPPASAQPGATWTVRPNPDEQTIGLTRATSSLPSATTLVVRPNPDAQTPPAARATIVRVSSPGGGFDWGDAAIGAAVGFALSMLGIGSATALARRRTDGGKAALSS
jgi:hypothetical protein